jgi:hypothetical protein
MPARCIPGNRLLTGVADKVQRQKVFDQDRSRQGSPESQIIFSVSRSWGTLGKAKSIGNPPFIEVPDAR